MGTVTPRCAGLVAPREGMRLQKIAASVPEDLAIVEIGSHTGLSTCWMASRAAAHVTAIDPWGDPRPGSEDDPFGLLTGDGVLEQFRRNVADERLGGRITALRTTSIEAARIWTKPVGLLFIDAVHTFDAVAADYLAWRPFLAPGAWVALHDYTRDPDHPYAGVAQAADEVIVPSGHWREPSVVEYVWTIQGLA